MEKNPHTQCDLSVTNTYQGSYRYDQKVMPPKCSIQTVDSQKFQIHEIVKEKIKTENEITEETWTDTKVVPVKETDTFREYLLPFGWKKEFRKRQVYVSEKGFRERWDVSLTR